MVEPQGIELRDTNTCEGTSAAWQARRKSAGGHGVGGVALVGVDLEHGSAVRERAVPRLVALGVVRVDGVGHVGREARRRGEGAVAIVAPAAAGDDEAVQHRLEQRPGRARGALGADLLVVEEAGDGGLRRARRGCSTSAVTAAQDEQRLSSRADAMSSCSSAEERRRREVVQHQVPGRDVGRVEPGRGGHELDEGPLRRRAEPPHRRQVHLLVEEQPALVDVPVEVDGQLRDAGQRLVQQDQHDLAVAPDQPAGQPQIPVEPGVDERAAVDLDRQLPPAHAAGVGTGLDPEVGRVGVGADDPEPGASAPRRRATARPRAHHPARRSSRRRRPSRARARRGGGSRPPRGGRRRWPRRGTARARRAGRRRGSGRTRRGPWAQSSRPGVLGSRSWAARPGSWRGAARRSGSGERARRGGRRTAGAGGAGAGAGRRAGRRARPRLDGSFERDAQGRPCAGRRPPGRDLRPARLRPLGRR